MSTLTKAQLHVDQLTFDVLAFEGEEQLNRPYLFRLRIAPVADLNKDKVKPGAPCRFVFGGKSGDERHLVSVILAIREQIVAGDGPIYVFEIGPAMALRGLSKRSQVYGTTNLTFSDLVKYKLGIDRSGRSYDVDKDEIAYSVDTPAGRYKLEGDSSSGSLTVQYQESDLNFISRLCEAMGVFYYFRTEQVARTSNTFREVIHFGDAVSTVKNDGVSLFFSRNAASVGNERWCWQLNVETRVTPKRYTVRGTFDRESAAHFDEFGTQSIGPATASVDRRGSVVEVVETLDFQGTLADVAATRADEIQSHQVVITGKSSHVKLGAGVRFSVTNTLGSVPNEMFVEKITHKFGQMDIDAVERAPAAYVNAFTAVKPDHYRPPRLLSKPVMPGVYYATVKATASGATRAEISDVGRYRIQLRFDEGTFDKNVLGSQQWTVRLAEPYGGPNNVGMHFPLVKDTEVLVAFVNGDPDRPIIVGTVANKDTPNLVGAKAKTVNRIRTLSGVLIEMDDGQ